MVRRRKGRSGARVGCACRAQPTERASRACWAPTGSVGNGQRRLAHLCTQTQRRRSASSIARRALSACRHPACMRSTVKRKLRSMRLGSPAAPTSASQRRTARAALRFLRTRWPRSARQANLRTMPTARAYAARRIFSTCSRNRRATIAAARARRWVSLLARSAAACFSIAAAASTSESQCARTSSNRRSSSLASCLARKNARRSAMRCSSAAMSSALRLLRSRASRPRSSRSAATFCTRLCLPRGEQRPSASAAMLSAIAAVGFAALSARTRSSARAWRAAAASAQSKG